MASAHLLNRDPALRRTPIGRLRAVRRSHGDDSWVEVAVLPYGRYDPRAPGRIIKTLAPGQPVTDAIFGKRTFEQRGMYERWLAQQDAEAVADEVEQAEKTREGVEFFERALRGG